MQRTVKQIANEDCGWSLKDNEFESIMSQVIEPVAQAYSDQNVNEALDRAAGIASSYGDHLMALEIKKLKK